MDLDKVKDTVKDWAKRAGWTSLYIFIATFLASAQAAGDITSLEVLKSAAIAAVLVVIKSVVVGRFGDPDAVRNQLSEIGLRAFHTFWQSFVAFAVVSGLDVESLKLAAIASAVNTLKGITFPPAAGSSTQHDSDSSGSDTVSLPADLAPVPVEEPAEVVLVEDDLEQYADEDEL